MTSLLAPPVCALCGGPGQWLDEPWGFDLCVHCEAACPRAGPECGDDPPLFDATVAMYRYADPVDHMVTALKFQGELGFARVLGMQLARAVRAADGRLPQVLIPMPLHAARYRERGFNQAAAIAAHVAPRLGVPQAPRLLARVRATAPQSGLSAAARRQNIQHAFAVIPGCRVPARVALLDDVLTTGSTAAAAAAALRAAGARHVTLWVCARAPRRSCAEGA